MTTWVLIFILWILGNLGRLVVNALERRHKDDIDRVVGLGESTIQHLSAKGINAAKVYIVVIPIEILRATLILLFLPTIVVFKLFPRLYELPVFANIQMYHQLLFSTEFRLVVLAFFKPKEALYLLFLIIGLIWLVNSERLKRDLNTEQSKQLDNP